MTTHVKQYINLTNGIEWIPSVGQDGFTFLRIQSTTIERKAWDDLLMIDCSADLLTHLALGYSCVVYDCGTNRPLSKTIYYAVPLIKYILNRRWYGLAPPEVVMQGRRGGKGMNVVVHFDAIYNALLPRTKARLDYFKRYVTGGPVELTGLSTSTPNDGDKEHYRRSLHTHYLPQLPH